VQVPRPSRRTISALGLLVALLPDKDPSKIEDNIGALKTYRKHFQNNPSRVLENPSPTYIHGEVHVTTAPDLYVDENGTKKLIKRDFNAKEPKGELVNIILKVMHEAASGTELGVGPAAVIYLDVSLQRQSSRKN
jgi:hypothetical protein